MSASLDSELSAIRSTVAALQPLDPSARLRVLAWLGDYFADGAPAPKPVASHAEEPALEPIATPTPAVDDQTPSQVDEYYDEDADDEWDEPEGADEAEDPATDGSFSTFSQFYDYINPKTARQKIATAGWWLEEQDGMESWRTFDVTKMLKEIGRPLGYVSGTLNQELRREDPIVDVVARSGESMQSHKAFMLSQFGRAFIQGRLGD